jgi:hypothetical protein
MSNPRSDAAIKALSIILAASVGLTACEAPKPHKGSKVDNQDKKADGSKGNPTTSGSSASGTTGGANSNTANNDSGPKIHSELDDLPQLNTALTVSISKLPDTLVICTVDGTPITVDAFKREFREALLSLQTMLTTQPEKVNDLLVRARELGVTLSADEHTKLLQSARKKESLENKTLAAFLKDKGLTEKQFDEQVLMLGLAFKAGTKMIETQLLSDMINRELLLESARSAGYYRLAMNKFIEFKHTQKYEDLVKASNDTPEQIKDDIINHEMMLLMMEQIAKQANISDDMLKGEYEKNKESFKHGERVRISHIVIAAPNFDNPPILSIRSQIKRAKPNITNEQLADEEKVLEMQQHNTALEILNRAIKGEDFKTLADRYTSDDGARAMKKGGDLGYLDLSMKVPGANGGKSDLERLTDSVKGLKVGTVVPDLVQTAYGWHIVKLTDRQPAGCLTFEEAKEPLRQYISQQNKQLAQLSWMRDRRKNATIKLSDEFVQAASKQKSEEKTTENASADTTGAGNAKTNANASADTGGKAVKAQ